MPCRSILECIGQTPMVSLEMVGYPHIFAKSEFLNPGGSIKDRVALYLIEEAEKEKKLRPGMTIVEASSGDTGIGVALVGVLKGYRVVIVMPEHMSEERRKIIRAFGAEFVFTPAEGGRLADRRRRNRDRRGCHPDRPAAGQEGGAAGGNVFRGQRLGRHPGVGQTRRRAPGGHRAARPGREIFFYRSHLAARPS